MPAIRIERGLPRFSCIPNSILEDKCLSWKSKGILSYLLSKPDKWKACVADIANNSNDGPDAVKTGLMELRKSGYAELRKEVCKGSQVAEYYLVVSDRKMFTSNGKQVTTRNRKPEVEKPEVENPLLENPHVENPPLSNTEGNKTELNKTESLPEPAAPVKLPKSKKPASLEKKDPRHQEFIKLWFESFESSFGRPYVMTNGKDAAAVKRLLDSLGEGHTARELVDIAKAAWDSPRKGETFNCKFSVEIASFVSHFGPIRIELEEAGVLASSRKAAEVDIDEINKGFITE